MPRKQLDFLGGDVNRVNGDEVRSEQPEPAQALDRPHPVLAHRAFDLVHGFVDMHVHGQIELGGERRHLAERRVGHGVGRMRREAEGDEFVVSIAIADRQSLAQVVCGVGRVGRGKLNDDEAVRRSYSRRKRRLERRVREEIHVVEAGDPAAQHLGAGEERAVAHELARHMLCFGRPDVFVQPAHERQVVGKAAHQRHGGVRMGVDEAGNQDLARKIDGFVLPESCARLPRGQDRLDPAIANRHRVVFEHFARGLDGHYPARKKK